MGKKHRWILPVLAILVVLTLIALDERLILRTYTVVSPKLTAEVRLAVVTDFHSSDNADDVVAMVTSCAPDAVLMVGDMFDDDIANRPTERTLSLMRQLSAQYPCYYVSGNHEAWTGEMDALYQQTEEAGVTVLRMSSGVLTVRGQRIALCGVPDPYEMVLSGAPDTEEQLRQRSKTWIQRISPSCWRIARSCWRSTRNSRSTSWCRVTRTAGRCGFRGC